MFENGVINNIFIYMLNDFLFAYIVLCVIAGTKNFNWIFFSYYLNIINNKICSAIERILQECV